MKVSAGFELRIAWLLGLLGLSTVILGEYEDIIAPSQVSSEGASTSSRLLSVTMNWFWRPCTIAAPKDEDFTICGRARRFSIGRFYPMRVFASFRSFALVRRGFPVEGGSVFPSLMRDRLDLACNS